MKVGLSGRIPEDDAVYFPVQLNSREFLYRQRRRSGKPVSGVLPSPRPVHLIFVFIAHSTLYYLLTGYFVIGVHGTTCLVVQMQGSPSPLLVDLDRILCVRE